MGDLINRKALLEKAWEADTQCGYVQVVDVGDIEDAHAVDAAPVVHGEWIEKEDWGVDDYYYTCSACGEDFVTIDGTPSENLWNYCPNCGAKMDGGNDND